MSARQPDSIAGVARRLGVSPRTVARWVVAGALEAQRGLPSHIDDGAIGVFLGDARWWGEWTVEGIPDAALRASAAALRGDVRLLTVEEVAARYRVTTGAVAAWIVSGRLRALRAFGRRWCVPEPLLDAFTPPARQGRSSPPVTDGERAEIARLRAQGLDVRAIARRLGRSLPTVRTCLRRGQLALALPEEAAS